MSEMIVPPFTDPETAARKVQMAEDLWNKRDPERVAAAYTEHSEWRNRTEFFQGRPAIAECERTPDPLVVKSANSCGRKVKTPAEPPTLHHLR